MVCTQCNKKDNISITRSLFLIESLFQKIGITEYLDKLRKLGDELKKTVHDADLNLQIEKYKDSIKEGHKVLVVAHSQGNLFTYEAYRKLPTWMQNYWEAVGVASLGRVL